MSAGALSPGATTVSRHRRLQPARRGALRSTRPQAAGATVSPYHPTGAGQRTGAMQHLWAGGAKGEDTLTRRYCAFGEATPGVHAATGVAIQGERACLLSSGAARLAALPRPIQDCECRVRVVCRPPRTTADRHPILWLLRSETALRGPAALSLKLEFDCHLPDSADGRQQPVARCCWTSAPRS